MITGFASAAGLFVVGCICCSAWPERRDPQPIAPPGPANTVDGFTAVERESIAPTSHWRDGGQQNDGTIIMGYWRWDPPDAGSEHPIYLISDYGFMLVNGGTVDLAQPVYVLACRERRTVLTFRSFDSFHQAVSGLPRDITVYRYAVGGGGAAVGIGEQHRAVVALAFREAGVECREDKVVSYRLDARKLPLAPAAPDELLPAVERLSKVTGWRSPDTWFLHDN
jgi:hypothetical protein